ncbi:MAG: polyphenol oxidase family protein [Thermodesulfobacteriota bacterium]
MLLDHFQIPSHEGADAAQSASPARHRIPFFRFHGLSGETRVSHAVFTRIGGTSAPPFASLNTSYSTGDHPENVTRNLRIIAAALDAEVLLYMKQVHGTAVHVVSGGDAPEPQGGITADAMITDRPRAALMVKQADCQGVILYDPEKRILGLVHCGWRGNTLGILGTAVERMKKEFGCRVAVIRAAIGPSLGPCCAEFVAHEEIFPAPFRRFMVSENHFDLWGVSRWQLAEAGVREDNIETAGICTRCRADLFFSYRAEGTTGRFATVAMLRP